jgi:inositol hexakisphosphate/diphosphoinositol-pentakisphosphate kinase
MVELLRRLRQHGSLLRVVEQPIDALDQLAWPVVDVLLAFSSDTEMLQACVQYCERVKPRLINSVATQLEQLGDRATVTSVLRATSGVNVVETIVVDHADPAVQARFVETEHAIELDGCVVRKPFVEKPCAETDHSVRVYHANRGCTQLFRKAKSAASAFDAACSAVRRDAVYLYQPFIDTDGIDIKAYTLGSAGVYAESRVSPTASSAVERDASTGKQLRTRIDLRDDEVTMALNAAAAFGHKACGVDLLRDRVSGETYVCDVNGWAHLYADEYFERIVQMFLTEAQQHSP